MRYATARGSWTGTKNHSTRTIDAETVEFREGTYKQLLHDLRAKPGLVAMVYWPDIRNREDVGCNAFRGHLEEKYGKYSRKEFERDPAKKGVLFYLPPYEGAVVTVE